jgi:hypothetical protein
MLLDWWLGIEGISYLRERDVRSLVARAAASGGDIGKLEALGVQNFLDLDDLSITEEGEPVDPQSIISLPLANERCVLPPFNPAPDDPFLRRVAASGKKWVIVTDLSVEPAFVLDSHHFLRDALFNQPDRTRSACWHRPVMVRDMATKLGDVIGCLKVAPERPDDDVIDNDLILVWGSQRRINYRLRPTRSPITRHCDFGAKEAAKPRVTQQVGLSLPRERYPRNRAWKPHERQSRRLPRLETMPIPRHFPPPWTVKTTLLASSCAITRAPVEEPSTASTSDIPSCP